MGIRIGNRSGGEGHRSPNRTYERVWHGAMPMWPRQCGLHVWRDRGQHSVQTTYKAVEVLKVSEGLKLDLPLSAPT